MLCCMRDPLLVTVLQSCLYPAGTPRVGDCSPVHSCTCSGSHHWKTGSTHQTAVTLRWSLNQGEWRTAGETLNVNDNTLVLAVLLFSLDWWELEHKWRFFFFFFSKWFQIAPAEGMDAKQRMVIIVGPPEAQFKVLHLHSWINALNTS